MNYKLRKVLFFPRDLLRELKFAWQRATRGFSDRDWWSIDYHIADILSKALPMYIDRGHGVSMGFFEGDDFESDEAHEKAITKQKEEYLKYADFFKRYCDGGVWTKEETAKELNGVTTEEYEEAMQWLATNFSGLWD